jgi:hypothetical protein
VPTSVEVGIVLATFVPAAKIAAKIPFVLAISPSSRHFIQQALQVELDAAGVVGRKRNTYLLGLGSDLGDLGDSPKRNSSVPFDDVEEEMLVLFASVAEYGGRCSEGGVLA